MADIGIRSTTITAVPKDYQVQGTQELALKGVRAVLDGTAAASTYYPAVQLLDPNGNVMLTAISQVGTAAGASVNTTWFPGVDEDETSNGRVVVAETLTLPTWTSSVSSANPIPNGVACLVSVQGTCSHWNLALDQGVPEADAMFPSKPPGVTRASTQVGLDPETIFAWPSAFPHAAGHDSTFQINMGSGFSHVEPIGGPFTTPQGGHFYTYSLVGQGQVARFRINDSPLTDNYGAFQIIIYGVPAVTGGVTSVSSTNTGIAVANGTTTPALTLATLDVIAADGPPAADWSNNSHKITSVATPTLSGDAATKGYVDGIVIPGGASNVQVFGAGAGQTWNKPTGTKVVEVICIGSGAQGGGGFTGSGAASISGGGGGAGGAVTRAIMQASDVSTPQTVAVGAGGSGAGTAGNPGANGASTTFGSLVFAGGGGGGAAGASGTSVSGGAGGSISESASGVTNPAFTGSPGVGGQGAGRPTAGAVGQNAEYGGASGGGSTSGGSGKFGGCSIQGGPGGGAGGGSTTTTGQGGGQGGTVQSYAGTGGGGGSAGTGGGAPTAGGNGTSFLGSFCGSAGGGGGGGSTGQVGKNGGTGGIGAGGGGGGASANTTGGTGGAGGDGRCIVISW